MAKSKHVIEKVIARSEAHLWLAKHRLNHALAYVQIENPSNLVPYHNLDHCLTVTKWCGRLASIVNLPEEEEKALILAAIFHDFDHTAGKEEDDVNIQRALKGLNRFCEIHRVECAIRDLAIANIQVTQFPFIHEPQTLAQKIIRDADILQSLEPNRVEVLVDGLRKELEVKFRRKITRSEFCENQVSFLEGIKLYTTPAQVMFDAAKPYLFSEFTALAERSKRKRV